MNRLLIKVLVGFLSLVIGLTAFVVWKTLRRSGGRNSMPVTGTVPMAPTFPDTRVGGCGPTVNGESAFDRYLRSGARFTRTATRSERGLVIADGIEQGRKLSRYDRISFPKPNDKNLMDWESEKARVRNFIWTHWKEHKRAYLIQTIVYGDTIGTSYVFVEPDESGNWGVAWRTAWLYQEVDDSPFLLSVDWVKPNGYNEPGTPLNADEKPDPLKHALEFRDKCGDVDLAHGSV
jgi:hypothetical protein